LPGGLLINDGKRIINTLEKIARGKIRNNNYINTFFKKVFLISKIFLKNII